MLTHTFSGPRIRAQSSGRITRHIALAIGMGLVLSAEPASAQMGKALNVTVSAGIAEYDLSGTGTTGVGALTLSIPLFSFLTIDPSVGFLRYEPQLSGSSTTFLLPEVSARLQAPGDRLNPYLALGGGMAAVVGGNGDSDFTLHAALGTYLWFNQSWAIRPEARIRGIDPFVGTTADVTLGLTFKL